MLRLQCKEAVAALRTTGTGPTDYHVLAALDIHLAECAACRAVCLRFIRLEELLAEPDTDLDDTPPPPAFAAKPAVESRS